MALQETMLDGTVVDKVQIAINRYKAFEPPEGYYLAFSGGKDSVCIKALADMAGVKYDAHYSVTSVDPPELVAFIRDKYPDVSRDIPHDKDGKPITMWNLIPKKNMPPTMTVRYCCAALKETHGQGRVVVTGVRWDESVRRKNSRHLVDIGGKSSGIIFNNDNNEAKRMVEQCYRTRKTLVNPIIDWTDEEVWEFIRKYNISYCKLYDEGRKRIGCIGCPMNHKQAEEDFVHYPTYRKMYIKAFEKMIEEANKKGKPFKLGKTGEEVMEWWLGHKNTPKELEGQINIFEQEILEEIKNG